MKFIIYNGQNKFTVDNVSIPDLQKFVPDIDQDITPEMQSLNFDLYNFRITATRSVIEEDDFFIPNDDLQKEVDEGIHWQQETIH